MLSLQLLWQLRDDSLLLDELETLRIGSLTASRSATASVRAFCAKPIGKVGG